MPTNRPPMLIGGKERRAIVMSPYDPAWRQTYEQHAIAMRSALGATALRIEHIGSRSLPGLAAKPIVDILLLVRDPAVESSYVPGHLSC